MTIQPGLPPQLPLATEPPAAGQQRRRWRRSLPTRSWHDLRTRACQRELSSSTTTACAFVETLAVWSKEQRFTLAVAISTRSVAQGPVDGIPAALVPLDVDADPRVSFLERGKALERQMPDTLGHVVGGSPNPVPVVFSARLVSNPAPLLPQVEVVGNAPAISVPDAWLIHEVTEDGGTLLLTWDVLEGVFPDGMVSDMVESHLCLLEQLAHEPATWDQTARECLPERQLALRRAVNATAVPLPPVLLHELFWDQARRTPEAPAVIAGERICTYHELKTGAAVLAGRLHVLGAQPGRMVAVAMDKGWEQPLAVLGILASGAAYVPVAPDLPEERFRHLLRHAEVDVVVTQPGLADALPWPAEVRRLVVDEALLAAGNPPEPNRRQEPGDLAYVIYTSGSSGQPKGVMIDHRGAVNTILDMNRRFHIGPRDRVLALASLSFDLSVYDIFGLLAVGGTVVMPEAGTSRAPWQWTEMMSRHNVTLWNTVPALMEMLCGFTHGRKERLPVSLRLVLMSGDWIPVSLPDRIRHLAATGVEVIGLGGATEASIWSNYYRIGAVDPAWSSIPYGTPLANQWFEVLDSALRRRPNWVPGDLYIGGLGVAMGYWRDEERTRRSFIQHPRTGERLYRTGDLGRYLPDGNLEFLGREDFQVKIHGYRVELGEIEAALLTHQDVTGALVTAIGAPHGDKRLVAYVTCPDGSTPLSDRNELATSLREHVAAKLPPYMVPAHIVPLATFPLTANGKIDRKALSMP